MSVTLHDRLEDWVAAEPDRIPVAMTIHALAKTAVQIALLVGLGPLVGDVAAATGRSNGGDAQKQLDVWANALFRDALAELPVCAFASEEVDGVVALRRDGCLAVAIDPLDGSGGIDANASLGSIFSILPADEATDPFSQAGFDQLAAGLFLYGPQTALVLTVGQGTDAYVLDRRSNEFVLTHPRLNVPRTRHEFAVNASNYRHWEQPVRAYVDDCLSGRTGPLHADFNMRWMGCLAAEAYRILLRGGLYLYPCDARSGYEAGRLRLLYEANPIALLLEQAGGAATDGQFRILEMAPRTLHQRTGLVFGSRDMVDLVGAYHAGAMSAGARSPLFGRRGLFRV